MSDLFFQVGRKLGHAVIPAARKTRWAWHLLTGSEQESIQAENQMGAAMAQEVPVCGAADRPTADSGLAAEISLRLTARLRNEARTFTVQFVRTGSATAFSLPGGFIFLDMDLLDLCVRDPDELAFVVGHEMGHIIRRHALDRWIAGVGIKVISGLISRGRLGAWWQQNGRELLHSAYSRDQEYEADEFGFRLARAAGYDPAGAFRLFARFQALRDTPGGLSQHFASHPPEADRLKRLEAVQRKLEAPPAPQPGT